MISIPLSRVYILMKINVQKLQKKLCVLERMEGQQLPSLCMNTDFELWMNTRDRLLQKLWSGDNKADSCTCAGVGYHTVLDSFRVDQVS